MHEIFFKVESSDYGEGFFLQEYKGNFYLVSGGESREGTNYKKWAFPQDKDRNPRETALPVSVKLGHREEAVKLIQGVLEQLTGVDKSDPPF